MTAAEGFPALLRQAMERRRVTQRDFAKLCGISHGLPPLMLNGSRTPPLEKVDAMVRCLELTGDEAAAFREAALLAHAPTQVSELIAALRRDLSQMGEQSRLMSEQHTLILRELARLGIQLPEVSNG